MISCCVTKPQSSSHWTSPSWPLWPFTLWLDCGPLRKLALVWRQSWHHHALIFHRIVFFLLFFSSLSSSPFSQCYYNMRSHSHHPEHSYQLKGWVLLAYAFTTCTTSTLGCFYVCVTTFRIIKGSCFSALSLSLRSRKHIQQPDADGCRWKGFLCRISATSTLLVSLSSRLKNNEHKCFLLCFTKAIGLLGEVFVSTQSID